MYKEDPRFERPVNNVVKIWRYMTDSRYTNKKLKTFGYPENYESKRL